MEKTKNTRSDMVKDMEYKVSVIIPMYNVATKIDSCIHSLLSQTLDGVELIFVDDCSADDTINQVNNLLKQSNRCSSAKICKHDENKGVAAARNTGLENATGEYIYYVDADDYIELNTLDVLYKTALDNNADIVGCEWFLSFNKNERLMSQPQVETGEEAFIKMCHGVMRWNLWLFLVKRSLYEENKICFIPRMNMGEDMMAMMKLMLCAKKYIMMNQAFYHYIQTNTGSLTKSYHKYCDQISSNVSEVDTFLRQNNKIDLLKQIYQLKLALKLPLLISDREADYVLWQKWFSESNSYINECEDVSWRTRFVQWAAFNHQYWMVKLYYWLVIKFVYGIIYK